MEFHDFQLRAWTLDKKSAAVLVHSSPAGAMRQPKIVVLEWEKLNKFWKIFQPDSGRMPTNATDIQLTEGGQALADVVFPDIVVRLLAQSIERIDPEDGIRVRLCLDNALYDLPWEYLIVPDLVGHRSLGGFLVLDARISLVREPPQPGMHKQARRKKQRLLFFGTRQCSTTGVDLWKTAEERDSLFKALEPANAHLETRAIFSNETDCQTALMKLKETIDIFHYSGHTDIENGEGFLVASDVDSEDKSFDRLYANKLGALLSRAGTTLAVFSACNSGNWAFVEPLLRARVPVIVAAQGIVYVPVATAFCQQLYSALAIGLSLDEAVTWARMRLLETGVLPPSLQWQWGAFMVYMLTPDAVLFPKPRNQKVAEQQDVARQNRQATIINVTPKIGGSQSRFQEGQNMNKTTILFFASNPQNTNVVNLGEEARSIDRKMRESDYRDLFEFITSWAVRPTDLLDEMNKRIPTIVHFSGHGSGKDGLVFTDNQGKSKFVSTDALKAVFSLVKDKVRLVVLNACLSIVQGEAISEIIDCVVGMNKSIGDEAAISFAAYFYSALGYGRSIKEAFEQGKVALILEGIPEENTPVLLHRKEIDPSTIKLILE